MSFSYRKENLPLARSLRRNMTKEERHLLYDFLRDYPVKFRKQVPIGNYIADFYCATAGLIIEVDGSQHYESAGKQADSVRSSYLESLGLTVVRYSNREINTEFKGVCSSIDQMVKSGRTG